MIQKYKRNIFLYNKKNELITYVDIDESDNLINYYSLDNSTLTRFNTNVYKEKNKLHTDSKKAKIVFGEECQLFHMFLEENDSYCKVIKKNSVRIDQPIILSTTYLHNEDFVEAFTINPSIVQYWLKKL